MDSHVMTEIDAVDAYRRWVLKTRRRAWRNVWKMIDTTTSQLAARVLQGRRRRSRTPEPFNAAAEFRREIAPMIARVVEAAGVGNTKSLRLRAKPKGRSSRKR